jgi:malate-CoA ligase subunit alpha
VRQQAGRRGHAGCRALREGGDPINGSSFDDILELFQNDPDTDAVMMMIGEIGGPQAAEAAGWVQSHKLNPIVADIAGLSVSGITVALIPSSMWKTMARVLGVRAAVS